MIQLQIQILIFLAIGWIFGKKDWISKSTASQLNFLVMNLILPCSIFHAFQSPQAKNLLQSGFQFLLLAILIQIAMIVIGHLSWIWIKKPLEKLNLEYGTIFNNAGTLGMVIGNAAFGEIGVFYTSLFALPLRIGMWSYGLMLYSKQDEVSLKKSLKKVAFNPCFLATVFGLFSLFLQMQGFELPSFINSTISSIGQCNTVMIMIGIGATLSEISFKQMKNALPLFYCLTRLFIIPLMWLIVLHVFGLLGDISGKVCVLELAMPAPVTMAMMSQKHEKDPLFASNLIFLSTLLSMLTLPLWNWILISYF